MKIMMKCVEAFKPRVQDIGRILGTFGMVQTKVLHNLRICDLTLSYNTVEYFILFLHFSVSSFPLFGELLFGV